MALHKQTVTHLAVDQLVAHPGNLRHDLGDLGQLAETIREHGVLQPITVTEHRTEPDQYVLLLGHRRLAASVLAGLEKLPAVIRHGVADADQIVLMLVENIHRRDLDPIERGEAYAALVHQGLTKREVGRRVGISESAIAKYIALLELDEESREELRNGSLPVKKAVEEIRASRQQVREAAGRPRMGPPEASRSMSWFNSHHRLAPVVRRLCTHRDRPTVGHCGCGPCWEQAIREEQDVPEHAADLSTGLPVDEMAVRRRLDGDKNVPINKAERIELVRIARERGWSYGEITKQTGVTRPERYRPNPERKTA